MHYCDFEKNAIFELIFEKSLNFKFLSMVDELSIDLTLLPLDSEPMIQGLTYVVIPN